MIHSVRSRDEDILKHRRRRRRRRRLSMEIKLKKKRWLFYNRENVAFPLDDKLIKL